MKLGVLIFWMGSGTMWHEMAVNLNNETVKVLGVYFWNNKNLEPYQTFCEHIVKIENF